MSAAVVLTSGGLDSTVCLAVARQECAGVVALTFAYGQRHGIEVARAAAVAGAAGAEHVVVTLDLARWGGSALTDDALEVPAPAPSPPAEPGGIPVTYVPGRNLVFLSIAVAMAEARHLDAVYIGVNAVDYSGYPDCRPAFLEAFERAAALGLRRGVEGRPVAVRAPLVQRTKGEIVRLGTTLGAPLELTWSCYRAGPVPCGACDACALRARGFADAGVADPALA